MAIQLIVNADDLGYTPGVSEGIIRCSLSGIVSSASAIVNMPDSEAGLSQAIVRAPKLGLGLHFNLTSGTPVSAARSVPDLVDEAGRFYHREEMLRRLPVLSLDQVEIELTAQLHRFIEVTGRKPDHLDSHHHITYLDKRILETFLSIAHEKGLPVRQPVSKEKEAGLFLDAYPDVDAGTAQTAGRGLRQRIEHSGMHAPDHFVADFYDMRTTLGDLLNYLTSLEIGVTEMMCHPAVVDESLRRLSTYVDRRADELAALCHPSVAELIAAEGIELVTYAALEPLA